MDTPNDASLGGLISVENLSSDEYLNLVRIYIIQIIWFLSYRYVCVTLKDHCVVWNVARERLTLLCALGMGTLGLNALRIIDRSCLCVCYL